MSLLKWAIFGLALLPVLEIAVFVWVVLWLGFVAAVALSIATTLLGLAVVRHAGRSERERLRTAFADTTVTQVTLTGPGVLMLLGGILLVLPGFLTDLAGLLLLIPGLRAWIHATFSRADRRHPPGPPGVVDLTPEEWQHLPEERLHHQPQDAPKP